MSRLQPVVLAIGIMGIAIGNMGKVIRPVTLQGYHRS